MGNTDSRKERSIRQPKSWKAPSRPLVPAGPTTVVTVPPGSAGTTIQVPHPRIKGAFISVHVPPSAKAGQAMLVPVPSQTGTSAKRTSAPKTTASPAGVAAFGGAVGGAILGDHIAEHGLDATGDAVGEGIVDAAEATEDFAVDAGEFTVDAAEDLGDFVMDLFQVCTKRSCYH